MKAEIRTIQTEMQDSKTCQVNEICIGKPYQQSSSR